MTQLFICLNPVKTHFLCKNTLDVDFSDTCDICSYRKLIPLFLSYEDICTFDNCKCYKKHKLNNLFNNIKIKLREHDFPRSFFYRNRKRFDKKINLSLRLINILE
jgi:hypothetical protein